jgi:hypothetical protein
VDLLRGAAGRRRDLQGAQPGVALVELGFVVPAIVLQFLPDSNAWFRTVNPR